MIYIFLSSLEIKVPPESFVVRSPKDNEFCQLSAYHQFAVDLVV